MGELIWLAERLAVLVEHARRRIAQGLRIARTERVAGKRGFHRLVMLRERALRHEPTREEPRDSFRVHDEGSHAVGGIFVRLEVWDISTGPGRSIPGYALT